MIHFQIEVTAEQWRIILDTLDEYATKTGGPKGVVARSLYHKILKESKPVEHKEEKPKK